MKDIVFRTPFNYDADAVSVASGLSCLDESLAVQASRDECDINTIVARFGLTGSLPTNVAAPTYGDFTGVSDYQSALAVISAADDSFYSMPAEIRSRFNNNPAKFVDFCSDVSNLEEMKSMGLVVKSPSGESFGGTPNDSVEAPPAGGSTVPT
jgi:phage internal scaffolding protein